MCVYAARLNNLLNEAYFMKYYNKPIILAYAFSSFATNNQIIELDVQLHGMALCTL